MAASAGAARPLAGLWSEQASVAGMGWEEPGAEAAPGGLEAVEREASQPMIAFNLACYAC